MLTTKQNFIETLKGGSPDRFVNQYEAVSLLFHPFLLSSPLLKKGDMDVVNAWGVTKSWPIGTPGAFPVHTPDKIVIKDIDHWRDYVKVPKVVYDAEEWEPFIEAAEKIDRKEQFVMPFFAPGVFEQSHYLLEIQNCLMGFYTNPDEMHEIIDMITEFELDYAAEICKYIKPDGLFHHDDWGSQLAPFFHAETLLELVGPYMKRVVNAAHENDFFFDLHSCGHIESLAPAMVEMGIDSWQGQSMNDKHKVAVENPRLIVDVDAPAYAPDAPEEVVRAELEKFVADYKGLPAYVGLNFGHHPQEWPILYELSRKAFSE